MQQAYGTKSVVTENFSFLPFLRVQVVVAPHAQRLRAAAGRQCKTSSDLQSNYF